MNEADFIWMNGEVVPWSQAKVHVLTHGLHYGSGVFEGVLAYETERGTAIFRHKDHLERLKLSAQLFHMELPYSTEELRQATHELIRRNRLSSCYIRPIAFRGYGEMGLYALNAKVDVAIAVWPWGAYLGEDGKRKGIRCRVASWRRMSPDSFIPQAKACGQYLNSILAKIEATQSGYDEAIILDHDGDVSEGSGENIFMVRGDYLITPPASASALDGITARSAMQIAQDLGFKLHVRDIARGELYVADELFLTGTAAEIVPVREVDDHVLGPPGEITRAIQDRFEETVTGKRSEYLEWLDFVEPATTQRGQPASSGVKSTAQSADQSQEASSAA